MNKVLSVDTIKRGKLYAQKRSLEKKCGKLKKRIEELEIEVCYAKRGV